MVSQQDKILLADFGFKDLNHLRNLSKATLWERKKNYSFLWRIKMAGKYRGVSTPVKKDIEKLFTEYEDYLIRNQQGFPGMWTQNAKEQYNYLFERLENPWKLIRHGGLLFSIYDPYNVLWFRAISDKELIDALQYCMKESRIKGARCKPAELSLSWQRCKDSYSSTIKSSFSFQKMKENDIALLICDNIDSTWDPYTSDWKPWSNSWSNLAYQKLNGLRERDYVSQNSKGSIVKSSVQNEFLQETTAQKILFKDIVHFAFYEGLANMKNAASILSSAFSGQNTRSAKKINGFYELHGIPKWWKQS
jgi:hypothetical protein